MQVNLNPGDVFEDLNLPGLPSNAEYVQHTNECYDWGTFAWALSTIADTQLSKYTCAPSIQRCAIEQMNDVLLNK